MPDLLPMIIVMVLLLGLVIFSDTQANAALRQGLVQGSGTGSITCNTTHRSSAQMNFQASGLGNGILALFVDCYYTNV
ncbi:MAG: hypothetical protein WAM14_19145 [Candidatus Nitrosopolaris sp.]